MNIRATVLSVIDGDTFETNKRIRLADVEAPEINAPGGLAAKRYLERLVGGRTVLYDAKARDVYGRVVAQVWVGHTDINAEMRKFLKGGAQ